MVKTVWKRGGRQRIGLAEAPRNGAQPAASSAADVRRGAAGSALAAANVASTFNPGALVTTSVDSECHPLSVAPAFPAALHPTTAAEAAAAWNAASAEAMAAATWDGGSGASQSGSHDGAAGSNSYYYDHDDDGGGSSITDGDSDSPHASMVSNGSMHDEDDDDDLLLSDDAEDSSEAGRGCCKSHCMPATRRSTSATIKLRERVRRTASAATATGRPPIAEGGRRGASAKGGDGAAAPMSDREPLVALGKRRKSGRSVTLMRRIIRSVRKSEYTVDLEEDNDGDAAELRGRDGAARGGKQRRFHLSPTWRPLFVVVWALVTLAVATGVFVATYNTFEHERQEEVEMECGAWRVLLEEHFTDTTNQIRLLANLVSTFHFRKPKGTLDRVSQLTHTHAPLEEPVLLCLSSSSRPPHTPHFLPFPLPPVPFAPPFALPQPGPSLSPTSLPFCPFFPSLSPPPPCSAPSCRF
ncbi:unnamed protein product [Closterium sp. Naga37s-1]|nr:unnamed protein product [Closterium sp. Naga37s-1]